MAKQYRALVGLNYIPAGSKDEKRVEAGGDCSDVPADEIDALLSMNPPAIEVYETKRQDDKVTVPLVAETTEADKE